MAGEDPEEREWAEQPRNAAGDEEDLGDPLAPLLEGPLTAEDAVHQRRTAYVCATPPPGAAERPDLSSPTRSLPAEARFRSPGGADSEEEDTATLESDDERLAEESG